MEKPVFQMGVAVPQFFGNIAFISTDCFFAFMRNIGDCGQRPATGIHQHDVKFINAYGIVQRSAYTRILAVNKLRHPTVQGVKVQRVVEKMHLYAAHCLEYRKGFGIRQHENHQ